MTYLEFVPFLEYAKSLGNTFPKDSEIFPNIQKEAQNDSEKVKENKIEKPN